MKTKDYEELLSKMKNQLESAIIGDPEMVPILTNSIVKIQKLLDNRADKVTYVEYPKSTNVE